MKILRRGFICLLAFCLLTFSGCSAAALKSSEEELTPVATVGKYDVPYELYRYVALTYKDQFEAGKSVDIWLGESGESLMAELKENIDISLVKMYTTVSLCEKYGLSADSPLVTSNVNVRMDELYESYGNDLKTYAKEIGEYHMNDGVYRFIVQNEVMSEELFYLLQSNGLIESDEEVLREMIQSDTFIRVKQILIADDNGKSDEENLATITDIYNQLENGADFDTMIGMYGQDLYMFNNEDGYYIAPGSRYQEFEEAAFSLDVGEYSGIVKTLAGYSIIMRYEKDPQYLDNHFSELCQEYYDGVYNTILEEHAATLTVTHLPALDNYSILTME